MMEEPKFWEYVTTDKDGFVNGIREDAPEKAKVAYDKYIKQRKELESKGIKV